MSFQEIRHTADWALRVRAQDLPGLFAEAARGMNVLSGIRLADGPRSQRTFAATGLDAESLLVAFLSELVFVVEQERLAFDEFEIQLAPQRIRVEMAGGPIESIDKAIKAVTFHNLKIRQDLSGFEVEIVFDV